MSDDDDDGDKRAALRTIRAFNKWCTSEARSPAIVTVSRCRCRQLFAMNRSAWLVGR